MPQKIGKAILGVLVLLQVYLVYSYYLARLGNDLASVAIYQPAATLVCLAIIGLAVFLSPHVDKKMALFIGIGMVFCFIADILDIDMSDFSVVLRGIILFFMGYTVYTVTCFIRTASWKALIPLGVTILIFAAVIGLIWGNVPANLRISLIAYGLLISALVSSGFSYWRWGPGGSLGGFLLFLGFLSLYLGDLEFAISAFYQPTGITIGPFLYSGGQTLVALAVFFHDRNFGRHKNAMEPEQLG